MNRSERNCLSEQVRSASIFAITLLLALCCQFAGASARSTDQLVESPAGNTQKKDTKPQYTLLLKDQSTEHKPDHSKTQNKKLPTKPGHEQKNRGKSDQTKRLKDFVESLEKAVNSHEWKLLVKHFIHQEYVRIQRDKILQGNTAQFLYELFYPGQHRLDNLSIFCVNHLLTVRTTFQCRIDMIQNFEVISTHGNVLKFRFDFLDGDCGITKSIWLTTDDDEHKISAGYG